MAILRRISRPQRKVDAAKRTIDEFYDEAITYKYEPEIDVAEGNDSFSSSLPEPPAEAAAAAPSFSLWYCCYRMSPRLQYYIILTALGLANAGDATEIASLSFCLSDQVFADNILKDDYKGKGATMSAAIFLGMLIGGILVGFKLLVWRSFL